MLLHKLTHVDPNHVPLVIKQELSQSFAQLGFSDTRRPQEDERTDRTILVLKPGTRTSDSIGNGRDRFGLIDHPAMKFCFHVEKFIPFCLQHAADRHPGPGADNLCNFIRSDFGPQKFGFRVSGS